MAEYQEARYYVGVLCPRCGLKNTVADIYRWGIEGWCMSCTREFKLTEAQKDIAKRQANDTANYSKSEGQGVAGDGCLCRMGDSDPMLHHSKCPHSGFW